MKGRKRTILVDTLGLILGVHVHPANIGDRAGAKPLLEKIRGCFPRLCVVFADAGYKGKQFVEWVLEKTGLSLEVVERSESDKGCFVLLPRRWVVERTFAWLGRYRRLSKDYEGLCETSEGWIYIAMTQLMLKRLA